MSEAGGGRPGADRDADQPCSAQLARQRELSLLAGPAGDGRPRALQAPQLLSQNNLTDVSVLASIIAIAAVGEAMVVITRNIDLSVEAIIGLVAFSSPTSSTAQLSTTPVAVAVRRRSRAVLGMFDGIIVDGVQGPSIVATLGTLSIYRGIDFLLAGGKQVTLTQLPQGYTDAPRRRCWASRSSSSSGSSIVAICAVVLRPTALRPLGLRRRQQPRGGGDPRHPVERARLRRLLRLRSPVRGRRGDVGVI